MKLKIITYSDLLSGTNKYSEDDILNIYSHMLDSVLTFAEAFSEEVNRKYEIVDFKKNIYFDENRAIQAVLEALDDLKRLKDFHPVKNPNKVKYASYLSFWWLQRKPMAVGNIPNDLPEELLVRLYNFNETFLISFVLTELFNKKDLVCCCDVQKANEYKKQWQQIQEYLFYFFCYRAITPKSIEAFLIGALLHPVWNTNDGVWII